MMVTDHIHTIDAGDMVAGWCNEPATGALYLNEQYFQNNAK
jgi:hypothetical protein